MGYKANEQKGIKPAEKTLCYRQKLPDGTVNIASITAYSIDPAGNYKAWVNHPVYGTELMTPREGRLEGFEPVFALIEEDIPRIVALATEAQEARIATLEAQVAALMAVKAATVAVKASAAKVAAPKQDEGKKTPPPPGPTASEGSDLDFLDGEGA